MQRVFCILDVWFMVTVYQSGHWQEGDNGSNMFNWGGTIYIIVARVKEIN